MAKLIEIEIDTTEIKQLAATLLKQSRDVSPAMDEIAGILEEAVQDNFLQEGRPEKWQKLAEATKKARVRGRRARGEANILRQSAGGLFSSISSESSATEASVSAAKIYAAIHHFGGEAGRGRKVSIPARPYLRLTREDEDKIVEVLQKFLG